jgi:serine/threonine protein kinase
MTDENRVKSLFAQTTELPEEEREHFVRQACGSDAALLGRVQVLLKAYEARDAFMAKPTAAPTVQSDQGEGPGTIIGPYKILQLIGEGGFGSVFMAEQSQPVARRVALKIIKPGLDSGMVAARFEAERQALALMDHPHIARIFDGGITAPALGSRPYFVMEYVRGDPITAFADAHKLGVGERLELFTQVCGAVQHAHTKGIIHRDLKPGNVLVSMVDGRPFAKVIDFGIAKSLASRLTERTLFTEHSQLIGTPEYMSPEQAEGSTDIDTRTDVYALGVLLYELLTGATPFDAARLRSAAFVEMRRIIREEDPPAPSLRLSRDIQALAAAAAARNSEPARLGGLVKGELDWIVMKALDKDRAQRYDSPSQLAADVRRHLSGEPVVAAPPSMAYRARKFVRRNRAAALVGGAVAVGMFLAMIGVTAALVESRHTNAVLRANAKTAQGALGQFFVESIVGEDFGNDLPVFWSDQVETGNGEAYSLEYTLEKRDDPTSGELIVRQLVKTEDGWALPLNEQPDEAAAGSVGLLGMAQHATTVIREYREQRNNVITAVEHAMADVVASDPSDQRRAVAAELSTALSFAKGRRLKEARAALSRIDALMKDQEHAQSVADARFEVVLALAKAMIGPELVGPELPEPTSITTY